MFDRHTHTSPSHTTQNTTVHENKAPTDDSIRLAKEFEDKAWAKVQGAVLRDVPGFNVKFIELMKRPDRWNSASILFNLNGRPLTCEVNLDVALGAGEIIPRIADAIAQEVASQLLKIIPGVLR